MIAYLDCIRMSTKYTSGATSRPYLLNSNYKGVQALPIEIGNGWLHFLLFI